MLTKLTGLAFNLNHALDAGKLGAINVAAAKAHIEDGTIFDFLQERLGADFDISLMYNDDRAELLAEWRVLANDVDEERKFGIRRDGICLVLAYAIEGIQRRVRSKAT